MTFLVRRLPQQIPAKLILVFASNRLDWPDNLDPRVKSFLKLNELVFKPYDALDLQRILQIRVDKALQSGAVEPGVIEKIAALASRDHGDARRAVALLAKGAYLAEKTGQKIGLDLIDKAASRIEQDKYVTMIRTAPPQLQAAMAAVVEACPRKKKGAIATGQAYDAYRTFCAKAGMRPLTARAFGDLLTELDMYSFIRCHVLSRGRYGRTREIAMELPDDLVGNIHDAILMSLEMH